MLSPRTRSGVLNIIRTGNFREYVVIVVATLAVFLLSSRYEVYEAFYEFTRAHNDWDLDEIVITLAALSGFLAIFSWRRVRELKLQIIQRDQAEQALKANEQRFHALIENSADAITLIDRNGKVIYDSPAAPGLLGYAADANIGQNAFELIHPDDLPANRDLFAQVVARPADRVKSTFRMRHADGRWLWIEADLTNLLAEPSVGAIVANYRDITERREALAAQEASERRFRALIEHAPDGITLVNAAGRFDYISPSTERILGYRPADLPNHTPLELTHPDDRRAMLRVVHNLRQRQDQAATVQYRFAHRDGRWRWLETTITNLLARPGVNAFVFNYRDITEQHEAQAALVARDQRYEALLEHAPDAYAILDATGRFKFASSATKRVLGYEPETIVGRNPDELTHPDDLPALLLLLNDLWQTPRSSVTTSYRFQHQSGDWRWLETAITNLLHDPAVGGVVFNFHDITERRQTEAQLRQRLNELAAINRISATLRGTKTLGAMLPALLSETMALMNGSAGSIWRLTPDRSEVQLVCELGWDRVPPPFKLGEGIPGYVAATGETYLAREERTDPRLAESLRVAVPAGRGGVAVPIRVADSIMGVLYINSQLPQVFTPEAASLLTTVAEIAGGAIHRAELLEQTQRRLDQLGALRTIDKAINASTDVTFTLQALLAQVITQLAIDAADVLKFDPDAQLLTFAAGQGFRTRGMQQSLVRLGEGYSGQAALERQQIEVLDLRTVSGKFTRTRQIQGEGFVYYVVTPLIARGHVIGLLECYHRSPLTPNAEWRSFLEALAGQAAIAIENGTLLDNLRRSNTDLRLAYDATIEGWSAALDLRDHETEGHSQRVTGLTMRLAPLVGVPNDDLMNVKWGALLHDIGKMGVPDSILLKPAALTPAERELMERHPLYSHKLLSPISYLRGALDIPYCHHEKWDGTGYPQGLKGMRIPLAARAFAVVDVWDALTSSRPYRAAWPVAKVRDHIRALAGTHFDPAIVDVFLSLDLSRSL